MTDHQLDELVVVEVGDIACGDALAVSQHADLIGDLEHLVEVMRHVEDGDTAGLEASDGFEESLHIGTGE